MLSKGATLRSNTRERRLPDHLESSPDIPENAIMSSGIYRFGPFALNVSERLLLRHTAVIPLRGKNFDTLCVLVKNAGRLMRKEELLQAVWPDSTVDENNLSQGISILRKTLGEGAAGEDYIETVPRIGFRFVTPVTEAAPDAEPAPLARKGSTERLLPRQQIRYCRTADGVSIAYSTVGTGYPLMKAANWLNHLEYEWDSPIWRHWISELTRHHSLIRYDERGNGLSSWDVEDMSFAAWVRDLEAVIDTAAPEKFALLGISQGGAVAIDYAVRHPERVSHLILCGAYSRGYEHRGSHRALEARHALETLVRLDWGKSNPDFSSIFTSAYIPENTTEEHRRWFNELQRISASPQNAARIMKLCDGINIRELLPRVKVPTLVLHADRDHVIPAEEGRILATEIPNARYVRLSTGNHILLADEPAWKVFLKEVGDFLGWEKSQSHARVS
jgi:pimeloyl-ACP methyl ester carboxylesterase/DNA-binding winged helix-turn-helix (wHTH) protein